MLDTLDCKSKGMVAREMGYTYSWGRLTEDNGLEEVQRILDEKSRKVYRKIQEITGKNRLITGETHDKV